MRKILLLISVVFFFVSLKSSFAQSNISDFDTSSDSVRLINTKSSLGAVLRSAILPGLGQIYNESYWKVPIIWGLTGWFVYNWIQNNNYYIDYKNLYIQSVSIGQENSNYKIFREFYRDQRDLFAIYLGLTYFLNLVDAYVDAQLFNFDVNSIGDKISFNLRIKF